MDKFPKQPLETLDYDILADQWLAYGDRIVSATSVVTPTGSLTVTGTQILDGGTRVKVIVAGGTTGVSYKITTTMGTLSNLTKEKDFLIKVKEL